MRRFFFSLSAALVLSSSASAQCPTCPAVGTPFGFAVHPVRNAITGAFMSGEVAPVRSVFKVFPHPVLHRVRERERRVCR